MLRSAGKRAVCTFLYRQSCKANVGALPKHDFQCLMDAANALISNWMHCPVSRCRWSYKSVKWAPSLLLMANPSHHCNDAAIKLESVGDSALLQPYSSLSALRHQPPWQLRSLISEKGKNIAGRFHHTHAGCWLTAAKSAVTALFLRGDCNAAVDEVMGLYASFVVTQSFSTNAALGFRYSKPLHSLKAP